MHEVGRQTGGWEPVTGTHMIYQHGSLKQQQAQCYGAQLLTIPRGEQTEAVDNEMFVAVVTYLLCVGVY